MIRNANQLSHSLIAEIARKRPLAGMLAIMLLQVAELHETGRTGGTFVRPTLAVGELVAVLGLSVKESVARLREHQRLLQHDFRQKVLHLRRRLRLFAILVLGRVDGGVAAQLVESREALVADSTLVAVLVTAEYNGKPAVLTKTFNEEERKRINLRFVSVIGFFGAEHHAALVAGKLVLRSVSLFVRLQRRLQRERSIAYFTLKTNYLYIQINFSISDRSIAKRVFLTLKGFSRVCILKCLIRSEGFLNTLSQWEHSYCLELFTKRCFIFTYFLKPKSKAQSYPFSSTLLYPHIFLNSPFRFFVQQRHHRRLLTLVRDHKAILEIHLRLLILRARLGTCVFDFILFYRLLLFLLLFLLLLLFVLIGRLVLAGLALVGPPHVTVQAAKLLEDARALRATVDRPALLNAVHSEHVRVEITWRRLRFFFNDRVCAFSFSSGQKSLQNNYEIVTRKNYYASVFIAFSFRDIKLGMFFNIIE